MQRLSLTGGFLDPRPSISSQSNRLIQLAPPRFAMLTSAEAATNGCHLSQLARQRSTMLTRFGFSSAAATRSLSLSCLLTAASDECPPGVIEMSTCTCKPRVLQGFCQGPGSRRNGKRFICVPSQRQAPYPPRRHGDAQHPAHATHSSVHPSANLCLSVLFCSVCLPLALNSILPL
jgi:hypothetical protein